MFGGNGGGSFVREAGGRKEGEYTGTTDLGWSSGLRFPRCLFVWIVKGVWQPGRVTGESRIMIYETRQDMLCVVCVGDTDRIVPYVAK